MLPRNRPPVVAAWLSTQVAQAFAQTPATAPTEADALQLLARHAVAARGDTALADLTCTGIEERNGTRAAIRMFVRRQPFALRRELTADNGTRTVTNTDGVIAWDDSGFAGTDPTVADNRRSGAWQTAARAGLRPRRSDLAHRRPTLRGFAGRRDQPRVLVDRGTADRVLDPRPRGCAARGAAAGTRSATSRSSASIRCQCTDP